MNHLPHPHILERRPPKTTAEHHGDSFNGRLALLITRMVGNMWCAYIFAALAMMSLPAAIASGSLIVIVAWIAQTFLQLVLLSIIMTGQDIAAKASDERAELTYKDAEAVLHTSLEIQDHLIEQDGKLMNMLEVVQKVYGEPKPYIEAPAGSASGTYRGASQ